MATPENNPSRDAYLDLIKRAVTNYAYLGGSVSLDDFHCVRHYDLQKSEWKIEPLARPLTLLTKGQLDLIEKAVRTVIERNVPGDLIEAGVWRGGAIVLMRALLKAYEINDRKVIAADSFAGIPMNTRAKNDPVDNWRDRWVAGLEEVQQNIARFGLLDDRIEFVPGFFANTLPHLKGRQFAVMRLDSDSYDSVEESLVYLYPLLSKGGIIIIDDWHLVGCRVAVENFRAREGLAEPIVEYEKNAYWVKAS
ncbi:MAG TPA: TylF/MycF/NovP-related O-methyltransferase [Vitreimonas sp.]|jgi:hypothetical protein|nr:TylF/MycF/NovP-related O-methyltransferase [Vitreimonas sp.]